MGRTIRIEELSEHLCPYCMQIKENLHQHVFVSYVFISFCERCKEMFFTCKDGLGTHLCCNCKEIEFDKIRKGDWTIITHEPEVVLNDSHELVDKKMKMDTKWNTFIS
jgi:hypothetical protein